HAQPFHTIQQAVDANSLNGKVMVLQQGTHPPPGVPLNANVEVVTRWSPSTVRCRPVPFALPVALEYSANPAVRQAVVKAQENAQKHDLVETRKSLLEAEKHAAGNEKIALQLELASRFQDAQQFAESATWLEKAAALNG